jgi:hypothetical protein
MNRYALIAIIALSIGLSACGSKQRTGDNTTPPDYVAIVTTSISGGAAIAEIFGQQAIEAENWRACVAAEVISEASQSAASALANYGNEIPSIEVDCVGVPCSEPRLHSG